MIQFEKVLGAFSLLADIDATTARQNSIVVELAISEVNLMLKSGACNVDTHDRLCHACAAVAYYKYAVLLATRESGFTVGDIKMSALSVNNVTVAKQLRDDAIGSIADLIDCDSFAFVQV